MHAIRSLTQRSRFILFIFFIFLHIQFFFSSYYSWIVCVFYAESFFKADRIFAYILFIEFSYSNSRDPSFLFFLFLYATTNRENFASTSSSLSFMMIASSCTKSSTVSETSNDINKTDIIKHISTKEKILLNYDL